MAELRAQAPGWQPSHPETERIWLPLRLVLEGVVTMTEVEHLPLERMADVLEGAQVLADVRMWHHANRDQDG